MEVVSNGLTQKPGRNFLKNRLVDGLSLVMEKNKIKFIFIMGNYDKYDLSCKDYSTKNHSSV